MCTDLGGRSRLRKEAGMSMKNGSVGTAVSGATVRESLPENVRTKEIARLKYYSQSTYAFTTLLYRALLLHYCLLDSIASEIP